MSSPMSEAKRSASHQVLRASGSSEEESTFVEDGANGYTLGPMDSNTDHESGDDFGARPSLSQTREQENRLDDDLALLHAERVVSSKNVSAHSDSLSKSQSMARSRSRRDEPQDDFDIATNPIHEQNAVYRPPEHPKTQFAKLFKKIHNSNVLIRWFTYIIPIMLLLLIPLLLGALLFHSANVGGVTLMWFSVWLEILWLTLWAGRILAKLIPWPLGVISSLFTNDSKKWRDMGKQLEIPATIFFWWLGVEISFLPTMKNHMVPGYTGDTSWMATVNKIIISIFVGATLNFVEKTIMQLIAISFHLRTYADRIEMNKFQIGSLVKLYKYSKEKISLDDSEFEEGGPSGPASGTRTPMQYVEKAQKNLAEAFTKVGDLAGKVAGDFTGKKIEKSTHPQQVVLMLLHTTSASQVLARRLYRTFIREGQDTVSSEDMRPAFDNHEEADAAFNMFDKDLNGDISMDELESVCVEIGRERKSITASLKDLDSVVSKLDNVLLSIVICVTVLVFITLISTSAAGVLTSAGSAVLALSWLFSATAQEFLQSVIFVFVKHPFDVGDRVSVYGNTGAMMKGDDYFVKEISLLYTEFKKMEGHIVQAPNSYLNTLFILNMRRSGGLAEGVPLTFKFGTTLDQIEQLRSRLLEFVTSEKREYQANVITELRDVVEAHSINLNVVFFYKSNWQNESLRLQRRNKFICALMVAMQDLKIEGPRMRLPGQNDGQPFYVQNLRAQFDEQNRQTATDSGPNMRDLPFISDPVTSPIRGGPVLRQGSTRPRPRGESITAMSRRVDFSLGMSGNSSGNISGDVYDDNRGAQVSEISFQSSSNSRQRASSEVNNRDRDMARSTSRTTGSARSRFGLNRASTDQQPQISRKRTPSHRNRFFGRGTDEDLMEQGMADIPEVEPGLGSSHTDPRSGMIRPRAFNTETATGSGPGRPRVRTSLGSIPVELHELK